MFVIPYPVINPVLVAVGPFEIRWYALAYIVGLILGWQYCNLLAKRWGAARTPVATAVDIDDFLVWATIGVVLGGRIGYVLFYNFPYYEAHPWQMVEVWHGGMSFHGGAIGVCVAIILFCRQRHLKLLRFADLIACAVPIGLCLGRIANFINDELWGRVAPKWLSWTAMYFPDDPLHQPRYPSELYEAFLEGLVLFLILFYLQRRPGVRAHPGTITGAFLLGYGSFRIVCEFFRQPDRQVGFLLEYFTMGQILSVPLVIAGIGLIFYACRRQQVVEA
ncbi:MAG: prolipoprotein diacylglyceryl transferase [Stellaceae bacterium]